MQAWRMGVKALAVYRDNCKVDQPLSVDTKVAVADVITAAAQNVLAEPARPVRERMPRSRSSRTFEFRVADCKGFCTVGEYDDGRPGEIFVRVSKQGSTLAGIMDAFAIAVSHGLQYGVPARRLRPGLRRDALRAGRHDRRPRPAHRVEPHRLPVPSSRSRVHVPRRAQSS